jgi:hypothetical protein
MKVAIVVAGEPPRSFGTERYSARVPGPFTTEDDSELRAAEPEGGTGVGAAAVAAGAAFSTLNGARRDHTRLAALTAAAAGALTLQRLARPLRQK